MANIVITTNTNRMLVAFNDLTATAGMVSGDWQKANISASLNIGNTDVFFTILNEQQFRFSYNGSAGSMQVDSINGVAPTDNVNLLALISAETASQVITISNTAPSSPAVNDIWIEVP